MKRNKLMRIATAMLVVTLLSTSVISGTFAKYVTTDYAQDAARVAKFGVLVSAEGMLFGDSYSKAPGNTIQATSEITTESVTAHNTSTGFGDSLVAPGTKNETGMTFSIKGTPEVSTKVHIDQPEGNKGTEDNADFINSDIYLTAGSYYIMEKLNANDVVITSDNMAKYYKLDGQSFTPLSAPPAANSTVYKMVQLTGVASGDGISGSVMTGAYYPIKWKVNGTALTGDANNVAGVNAALLTALGGDGTEYTPNYEFNKTAKITWEWIFGNDSWAESNNEAMHNWENTNLIDLEDTVLGQMIARAQMTNGSETYEIATGNTLSSLTKVNYAEVYAAQNSLNKVWIAYTGNAAPEYIANDQVPPIACLTVAFGARVTVEQVD